jgi:2-polyprenyl-6-methoxyphenol hydroxylase-like FAD-dependent oxidoreductase
VPAVRHVVVVGAGVAGPTLALALNRLGVEVELVEGQQVWQPVGVGVTLMGPALRALRAIGLIDRAVGSGAPVYRLAIGDASGEVTSVEALPRLNGPRYPGLVQISRPEFHAIVADAVRDAGIPVRLGVTVDAIRRVDDGRLEVRFSDCERAHCDLVVGADGIYSRVRALAFPEVPKPRFTGQAVWRAVVDRPEGFEPMFDEGTMYLFQSRGRSAGVIPTSGRRLHLFLVQDAASRSRPPTDALPALLRGLLADYGGFLGLLGDRITSPSEVVWHALEVLLAPSPWYRHGTVLIGDAAHTTTPHLASGAAIAIEDAIVLADELGAQEGLEEALESFMRRRFDRCRMVLEDSVQLCEWEKHAPADADPVGLTSRNWASLAGAV